LDLGLRAACRRFDRDSLLSGGDAGEGRKKMPGALGCRGYRGGSRLHGPKAAAGCTQSKGIGKKKRTARGKPNNRAPSWVLPLQRQNFDLGDSLFVICYWGFKSSGAGPILSLSPNHK
jgi:hypothetical protein